LDGEEEVNSIEGNTSEGEASIHEATVKRPPK
jgi:hypothetical protein